MRALAFSSLILALVLCSQTACESKPESNTKNTGPQVSQPAGGGGGTAKSHPTPSPHTKTPGGAGSHAGMPPGHPGGAGALPPGHPMPKGPTGDPHGPMAKPGALPNAPAQPVNPREVTPSGQAAEAQVPGLKFQVPVEWVSTPPSSSMRLAQWTVPGPGGDAQMLLFRFPGGGSVDANINRWKGQYQPAGGKSIDEVTTTEQLTIGSLNVTLVEIRGSFKGSSMPPSPPIQEATMLAAIVEGSGDPYFFKLNGASATIDVWKKAFRAFAQTLTVAT